MLWKYFKPILKENEYNVLCTQNKAIVACIIKILQEQNFENLYFKSLYLKFDAAKRLLYKLNPFSLLDLFKINNKQLDSQSRRQSILIFSSSLIISELTINQLINHSNIRAWVPTNQPYSLLFTNICSFCFHLVGWVLKN